MKTICFFTLLVISSMAIGDSTWSVTIEPEEDCLYYLRDCAVLSNGNAVISIVGAFEDPFLMCFDTEGEILWYRHILEKGGTSRAFESNGELVTLEDGFAVCYHSEPRATGINTDVAVVRMDSSGEILWTYILGEDDEEVWMSTDMISCSDGGLVVSGCPGQQLLGGFVFKLSSDGRLEWMTQPDEIEGFALSVLQTVDGDYCVLVCYNYSVDVQHITSDGLVSAPITVTETEMPFRATISCIDCSFWAFPAVESHVLYAKQLYPDYGTRNEISVQLPANSEVILADVLEGGLLLSGGIDDGGGDALFIRCDLNGNILWQQYYDMGGIDFFYSADYSNQGILAIGRTQTYPGEEWDFWIIMTDKNGFVEGAEVTENGTLVIEPERMHIELYTRGWVMACAVFNEEEEAIQSSHDLMESTGLKTGYLWIPDWQSLSGAEGWLVYASRYMEYDGILQEGIDSLLEIYPDTYFIWVSQGWDRKTMTVDDFFSI
ncbi:MAG: hypothetical protein KAT09_07335 [Candidatus Aegiribacteria sp.]|nr:hypothetical protein [Candidatus Aegiribacteria sp.]